MPDAGRPKSPLRLSVAERTALSQLAAAPRTSAAMRLRARIVVASDPELLSDRVYEAIRGWILSGELAPGMRVVESEIARVLGTSQTPAREAVRRLAHEGLVTYRPRLGNFVTEISQVEAREARE